MSANFAKLRRCAARESDDRRIRRACAHCGDQRRDRRDAPALEFGRRQNARPGIENLHRFRARGELTQQISGRGVDEARDQCGEQFRLLGRRKAAPAPDRACRARRSCSSRPSRARRKSRSARRRSGSAVFSRSSVSNTGASFVQSGSPRSRARAGRVGDRIEPRAFAALERDLLAERVGDDENIGEKDRRVEAETADRLQRRLDGQGGRSSRNRERSERGRGSRDIRGDSGRPGA